MKRLNQNAKVAIGLTVSAFVLPTPTPVSALTPTPLLPTIEYEAEEYVDVGGDYPDEQALPVSVYNVNDQIALNYINRGDYLEYDLEVPYSARFYFRYNVATGVGAHSIIELKVLRNGQWESVSIDHVPANGWDNFEWRTASKDVLFFESDQKVRIYASGLDDWQWNLESFEFKHNNFIQYPQPLKIEIDTAEYFDTSVAEDAVSKDPHPGFHSDVVGINYNTSGDWAEYKVDFPAKGFYDIDIEAATAIFGDVNLRFFLDGVELNSFPVLPPELGFGWAHWNTYDVGTYIPIDSKGERTIRIESYGNSVWQWNARRITLERKAAYGSGGIPAPLWTDPSPYED